MASEDEKQSGFSRRDFIKGAALAAGGAVLGGAASETVVGDAASAATGFPGKEPSACDGSQGLALINGRFLTMDHRDSVVSAVAIRNGRIAEVGRHAQAIGPCAQTINLRGATVIPGLIDSHVHFIRCGLNPGHEVRIIELAASIPELQQMISERAQTVPRGEFITCVGGWNINGLAERRLPTVAELDAAAPNHPVYLSTTGTGGGVTNTLGRAFFESKGVVVSAAGTLNTADGFIALRQAELAGDPIVSNRLTGTEEVIDFVSGLGMTMVHDVGGNGGFAGNPTLFVDLEPYDQALDLWREGNLKVRIRPFLYSDHDPGFDVARARIDNNLIRLGDEVFRLLGVGERVNASTTDPGFIDHCIYAAAHGWTVQQHSSNQDEITLHLQAFQEANAAAPIEKLRWSLTHVNSITDAADPGHDRHGYWRHDPGHGIHQRHRYGRQRRDTVPQDTRPDGRRSHPCGRRLRCHQRGAAESVADDVLHDHGKEQCGCRHQYPWTIMHSARGSADVHDRQRVFFV